MEKFPQPPPDRRLNRKSSQPQMQNYEDSNNNYSKTTNFNKNMVFTNDLNKLNFSDKRSNTNVEDNISNMDLIKQKNIEDMRKQIENFKILNEKKMFLNVGYNNLDVNYANFVLFGPSGSGKSTLLALLRGLYEPEKGAKLTIDGKSVEGVSLITDTVTLFPQEPEIFENTIAYSVQK